MKKIYLAGLLLFLTVPLLAQNPSSTSIVWKSPKVIDRISGLVSPDSGRLISYRADSVQWKDTHGATKQSYQVTGTIGTWSDINVSGQIVFQILSDGKRGTITFRKANGKTMATVYLLSGSEALVYAFTISSAKVL